jgi:hypothetical protein
MPLVCRTRSGDVCIWGTRRRSRPETDPSGGSSVFLPSACRIFRRMMAHQRVCFSAPSTRCTRHGPLHRALCRSPFLGSNVRHEVRFLATQTCGSCNSRDPRYSLVSSAERSVCTALRIGIQIPTETARAVRPGADTMIARKDWVYLVSRSCMR